MPSYIPQQAKKSKQQVSLKLDTELLAVLDDYCKFIDSGRDYVISQALRIVFRRDKDFAAWRAKQTAHASGPSGKPTEATGEGRTTAKRNAGVEL